MAWDNTKNTAADPDNPTADEQLTASEWNTHVDEGHWPSDELQFEIDSGDPVLVDPQNSNEIVARYDRSKGKWKVDALEAARVNSSTINAAQYSDFDSAISDVPDGGNLYIPAGVYDTADYGKINPPTSKGLNIIGDSGDGFDGYGTIIDNRGGAITSEIVNIDGGNSKRRNEINVKGLTVLSNGAATGYQFRDVPALKLVDCAYSADNKTSDNDAGFRFLGECFSSRVINCRATTDSGLAFENLSNGQDIEFIRCNANTVNGATAVYLDQRDCKWVGGQIGGASDYALIINDGETIVENVDFETVGQCIKLGDGSGVSDCQIRSPVFYDVEDEYVRWTENANDCVLLHPRNATGNTGGTDEYVFKTNCRRPKIIAGLRTTITSDLVDYGAINPTVDIIDGVTDDSQRSIINIKVEGTKVYNKADGNLNIWNGSDWILPDGSTV